MAKHISESDTRANFIDPSLRDSQWEAMHIIREHYFTDGRKLIGNKRGKRLFLDYLLKYNNANLAIVEAKKLGDHPTKGLQQALEYAEKLKINFVYATNGKQIYEFDRRSGKGNYIDSFPTPKNLYQRLYGEKNALREKLQAIPFLLTGNFGPRYYQEIAVDKVIESIADGQERILLTLATGTGRTFISFQIVHKLLTAKWNIEGEDRRPRILFLADRNVLADQAIRLLEENIAHTQALMGSVLDEEFGRLKQNGISLTPISAFAKTKSRGTPRRSESQFWNGKIPWLKSGELNDSFNINENTEYITEIGLQNSSATLFKKGTLLMAMYGATAGKLGILGMDSCTNQAVCSIQNENGLFDEIYVYFYLLSQRERIIRESSGGAQPNISKRYIDELKVPLPNIKDQLKLSKKFFDYQYGINSIVKYQTQKLNHLKALKSSLLDQAFKGEL